MRKGINKAYPYSVLFPVLLIIIWEMAVRTSLISLSQAVGPGAIALKMISLLGDSSFLTQVFFSLQRLLIGVFVAAILGTFVGIFLTISPNLNKLLSPTLQFLAGLPVIIWMPFWIMFFGLGELFKIGLASMAAFFMIYTHSYLAANSASKNFIEICQIYEKPKSQVLFKVLLPEALPSIFAALRVSLGIGWIVLFFVEYATAEIGRGGLGWFIANARAVGRIEEEFAALIILALIAFLIDKLISKIQNKVVFWKQNWSEINGR